MKVLFNTKVTLLAENNKYTDAFKCLKTYIYTSIHKYKYTYCT